MFRFVFALILGIAASGTHAAGVRELGNDDVRLTNAGADGDATVSVGYTAIAYNSDRDEYLLVWRQADSLNVYEVHAQVLGPDLTRSGAAQRVSFMGGNDADARWGVYDGFVESPNQNDAGHWLENVAVAYDSIHQKYLVVWSGDDDQAGLADGEYEIFGQLLNADATRYGAVKRLSATGKDGDATADAYSPAVTYDAASDRFLVVWEADGANDGRYQIDGVMVSADSVGILERERFTNLSGLDNGGDATDVRYSAYSPSTAAASGSFLVVWDGFDVIRGGANNRNIFWRTVTTAGAASLQHLENLVKDAWPVAVFAPATGNFIVQFQHESLGAWLSSAIRIGVDGALESGVPTLLDGISSGREPHSVVAADTIRNLLVARVNRDTQNVTQVDVNLISDTLTAETALQRISASQFPPQQVATAYNTSNHEIVVAWRGELASGESEIFGQRLAAEEITDLAIAKFEMSTDVVNAGENVVATLVVENLGASDANNGSLVFSHDGSDLAISSAQARNVTTGAAVFNCDVPRMVCALGTIAAGEEFRLEIVFDTSSVAQTKTYTVDARLSSDAADTDGSDNIAAKTFTVNKDGSGSPPPGGNPGDDNDGGGGGSLGLWLLAALVVSRRRIRL